MTSGKGIESLIPPNQNTDDDQSGRDQDKNQNQNKNPQPPTQNRQEKTQSTQSDRPEIQKNKESSSTKTPDSNINNTEERVSDDEAVFQIEVEKIKPNPFQPRKEYNQENLKELANSIREVGIIQPLVVSKVEEESDTGIKTYYQLISGERRLRASKLVGLERVPAIVRTEGSGQNKLSVALVENIQRDDLNPIEKARGYARLQDEFNLTQREVATKVGKARSSVANTLRLLNLPSEIQDALSAGKINESQARLLLSIEDTQKQTEAFQRLMSSELSTKQLRSQVKKKKSSSGGNRSSSNNQKDRQERFWEKQLEERFSAPVEISKKGDKGKLTIKFFSQEEWKGILNKLTGEA